MSIYIPKVFLKTRDEFNGPDRFFNLTKFVTDLSLEAGDLSAIVSDISDLQSDLGTVQSDLGTVQSEAETKVISLEITPFAESVQAQDTAIFVVPASMNGYVLKQFHVRHGAASTGAGNSTSVQVFRGNDDLLAGGFVNINAQSITPGGTVATDDNIVLATNDAVTVNIGSIPTGGVAPKGLFATLVFQPE
jgi:hypothetical protein